MSEHLWSKTPEAVTLDPSLTNADRRVYAFIDGQAWRKRAGSWVGSQLAIAQALGLSTRTVKRSIKKLVTAGYVRTERTIAHRTNLAYFVPARGQESHLSGDSPVTSQVTAVSPPADLHLYKEDQISRKDQTLSTKKSEALSCPEHGTLSVPSMKIEGQYYHAKDGGGWCSWFPGEQTSSADPYAKVIQR